MLHKESVILPVGLVRNMRISVTVKCLIIMMMLYLGDTSALRLVKASYWGVVMFEDVCFFGITLLLG
ncbi:MAG: hypothetical protein IKT83_04420 [Bacteroidaceae bacterium]|nr:hypothetical protein [Bacteroidaceae bacterium]